jgi:hypothetical protein
MDFNKLYEATMGNSIKNGVPVTIHSMSSPNRNFYDIEYSVKGKKDKISVHRQDSYTGKLLDAKSVLSKKYGNEMWKTQEDIFWGIIRALEYKGYSWV